ncbi:MAG: glycine cleavage system aminomethyltransferase GcvT [Hyphomicrobiaceae bacterium]
MAASDTPDPAGARLRHTPLHDIHVELGAKLVAFAGYAMPVQYPMGVLKEHLWTREHAGLFDVSHMGQALLAAGDGRHETAAAAIEALCPGDIGGLAPGQQRYSTLLADDGGILDDLMITRPSEPSHAGSLMLVVNAARKDFDFQFIASRLPGGVRLVPRPDNALLALQGPAAAAVMAAIAPGAADLAFMTAAPIPIGDAEALVSRSGYTGEDGFEISLRTSDAARVWNTFLADDRVRPVGLGARDSLRLEAGLCLYGHDIDETTSPVEAALTWAIAKRRRAARDFPGADRILSELREGPRRRRVGIRPDGRAPAREGTGILSVDGQSIGSITSGGFSPTLGAPIAMGYVDTRFAATGTPLQLIVRGKPQPAQIVGMPFVPHRYHRTS